MIINELKIYRIPSYLASYIVNDDDSDLTEAETSNYHDFLARIDELENGFKLKHVAIGDDLGFCAFNDLDNLGTDCLELIACYEAVPQ